MNDKDFENKYGKILDKVTATIQKEDDIEEKPPGKIQLYIPLKMHRFIKLNQGKKLQFIKHKNSSHGILYYTHLPGSYEGWYFYEEWLNITENESNKDIYILFDELINNL
jgi:hypothetical protein